MSCAHQMDELEMAEKKLGTLYASKSFELWDQQRRYFENFYVKSSRWGSEAKAAAKRLLKSYYTSVIRKFMSSMKNNTRFIRICYNYAKMFKDPSELFAYFDAKGLGSHNQEADRLRAQIIEKNQQQIPHNFNVSGNTSTESITSKKDSSDTLDTKYVGPESPELDRQYYKAVRKGDISANGQQKQIQGTSCYLQLEEVRLHDYFKKEYGVQKSKILQNENIKIYKQLAHNKWIIQQMTSFLNFNKAVDVYYKDNEKDDKYYIIQTTQIPQITAVNICYVEYIDNIPTVQKVNDVLRFNTKYASNILQLQKLIGNGGFGKVFKALLIQNNISFTIAVKFYIRKKDIMTTQVQKPSISASQLRELYGLAIINYRALNSRYTFQEIIDNQFTDDIEQKKDMLQNSAKSNRTSNKPRILQPNEQQTLKSQSYTQPDDSNYLDNLEQNIPFTKLYCGLIGSTGNGAICLEYLQADNLYDWAKRGPHSNVLDIIRYVVEMLRIVKYMHFLDILHSDIKVDNWMVMQGVQDGVKGVENNLKLLDFGKAIDLRLISVPDRPLRFDFRQLNAVSPAPAQRHGYLFDADVNGIAASMFSLLFADIMQQEDLIMVPNQSGSQIGLSEAHGTQKVHYNNSAMLVASRVRDLKQRYGPKAKILTDLLHTLLNRHHQGLPYAEEKRAHLQFLTRLITMYGSYLQ